MLVSPSDPLKLFLRGWSDSSEVKSTDQQPHGGSQPSGMRPGALFWPAGRHTDRQNTVNIIKINIKKKKIKNRICM